MLTFISFLYGVALGSFANLVADRLRVRSIFGGRSVCLNCSAQLTTRDLFPILSYLTAGGKCRHCKSRLSSVYLWSELGVGLLIALLPSVILQYVDISTVIGLYYAVFLYFIISVAIALCMAIAIYDIRHMIVPFETAAILFVLGIIATLVRQYVNGFELYDFFSGAIVALPFTFLYLISRGRWVGMGDVIMYASLGFLIGLPIGATAFFYSVWLGAFVALMLMILHKREYGLSSEIPFTPFIIIGAILAYYTQSDILGLYELLS